MLLGKEELRGEVLTMKGLAKRSCRRSTGQAIIEGVAMLTFLIPIMVGVTLLTLFIGIYSYYHLAILQVADAGARAAVDDRYWLGVERPEYKEANTENKIKNTVSDLWKRTGLAGSVSTDVDLSDPKTVAVTVTANNVPIPSGGFLPAGLSLKSTAAQPCNIDSPTGLIGLSVTYNTTDTMGIYIPAFGAGACNGAQHTGGPIPKFVRPAAPHEWHVDVAAPNSATTQIVFPIQHRPDLPY